jgi:hypothetical protein
MRYRARLARLEAQRPPVSYHVPVVRIPGAIDHADWEAYLATVPCACGSLDCQARTIGLVLPEQISIEAWEAKYTHRRQP